MPMFPVVDEDGLPTKGTGGTPGGFTGGGGGGPGGGSFGFGGGGLGVAFAPAGMRGVFGVDGHQRRRLGMPAVPGVTPGAPQPSDTVPAMLTPGEIVMNNGVTSDPQLAQALTHLNMMGAQRMMQQPQGFAFGGMAQGMAQRFAPTGGGMPAVQQQQPANYLGALLDKLDNTPSLSGGPQPFGPIGGGMIAAHQQQPLNDLGTLLAKIRSNGQLSAAQDNAFAKKYGRIVQAAMPDEFRMKGSGILRVTEDLVDNPETYSESAKGLIVNTRRALQTLREHHVDSEGIADFFQKFGRGGEYDAYKILEWLGYAYGGTVPQPHGYAYGGHVNPFLMALRYMNMPAGMAYGGMVPGYAMGGSVFGRAQQAMGGMFPNGMGRSAAQPAAAAPPSGTAAPGMANTAGGLYGNNGSWYSVDPRNPDQKKAGVWTDPQGNVRNRDGNLLSYDPRNPYSVMSQSYDPTARGVGMRQMGAFGEAGYWDPNGNQALMNSVRGEALANARAQQQGAGLRAQLAGMDPGAAASYRLEAGLRGSSDVARALNNARTQSMLAQQNYANSLAGSLLSNQNQQFTMENQTRNQDLLNNNQNERAKQQQWGQIGGQILGQGLGAFTGGMGGALGGAMMGGGGGRPPMNSNGGFGNIPYGPGN